MDRLRTPFFLLAIILSFFVVLVETGTALPGVLEGGQSPITAFQLPSQVNSAASNLNNAQQQMLAQASKQQRPSGLGVPDLALLDSIAFFTVALMGVAFLVPARLQGRVQGFVTLIFSLLLIGMAVRQILIALSLLMLMLGLLLSIPFGTIMYLILFGFFNRAGAYIALSIVMLLKVGVAGSLLFSQQRFLQSKGLVLLVLTSLLGTVAVSLLLGIVPGFLVSITDALAAIIIGLIAVIWAVILLIGSIIAIVKIMRLSRTIKI